MKPALIYLLVLCLPAFSMAQETDAASAELKLLRATNDRLAKENAALKAELAALKKKLAEAEPTTRPAALSAGGAGALPAPKKIVFMLDASGSMLNVFDEAREEVRKSIEELKPDQSFAVVLCQAHGATPFPKMLLPATEQNKARILAILPKLSPRDTDNFTESFKLALSMNPDLIWWRGDAPNDVSNELGDLKKLNARNVKVNTTPKLPPESKDKEHAARTMWFAWKLATDSGGTCFDESGQPITQQPPQPPPPQQPQPQPNVQLRINVNQK